MMDSSQAGPFTSLMFEKRRVVYVEEVADTLDVTRQHVLDLIEEGKLHAINVGGGTDSVRVPREFLTGIARRLAMTEAELLDLLEQTRKSASRKRPSWRIPIEAWHNFMKSRHSQADALAPR